MFNNVPPNGFPQIPDIEDLEKVVNDVSALQSTKANKAGIAPAFSAEANYSVGDLVYYEGTLYKCTTAHEAAAWDAEDFTETTIAAESADIQGDVSDLESIKANQITIAPTFSAETAYEAGDLVYYNGLTYRCTNDHEGAWDAADFAVTTISNELSELSSKLIIISQTETRTTNASGSTVLTSQHGRHVLGVRFLNMASGKSYVYSLGQSGDTVYVQITDETGVPIEDESITFEYTYIMY